jgi:hypothetical protein
MVAVGCPQVRRSLPILQAPLVLYGNPARVGGWWSSSRAQGAFDTPDVVHLCLPERFEEGRRCVTVLGFRDPREREGELLWPQRFDEAWARQQEADVKPYAWCTPSESPVLMADLTMKPIGEVE